MVWAMSSKIDDIDILMTLTLDIARLYDMESMSYDVVIDICGRRHDMESMSYDVVIDIGHVYVNVAQGPHDVVRDICRLDTTWNPCRTTSS